MKKFRYAFPISAYVVYALLLAVSVLSVVFAALRLGNAGGFISVYPVTDALTIALFSLCFLTILFLVCFSNYTFSENEISVSRLFFKKRVRKENLIKLVTDEESGVSALYYYGTERGEQTVSFLIVCVPKKQRDAFVSALRDFKRDIVIESNPKKFEE